MKKRIQLTGLLLALLMLFSLLAACTPEEALHNAAELAELLEEDTDTSAEKDVSVLPAEPDAAPDSGGRNGADTQESAEETPDEDGIYTSKEDLALYLHLYGHLPSNFVTKDEARAAGWSGGSLEPYCPGKCIGGDRFGNREGLLPKAKGRVWYECDVNTLGAKSRGAERLVYSSDGLIFYTGDHYESFTQLY